MTFILGGDARLKSQGNLVKIIETESKEKFDKKGNATVRNRYLVKLEKGATQWFEEDSLKPAYDKEFDLGLNKLLIDVNLRDGNFHYVEMLRKQRKELGA